MSRPRRIRLLQIGLPIACVAAAIVARLLLDPLLGDQVPFITIFIAVIACAWYAGLAAGLVAVALGELGLAYFVMQPRGALVVADPETRAGLLVFGGVSAVLIALIGVARRSQRRAEQQEEWLRVTLDAIGDAVITTDVDGRVTFLNPVAERMTGWARAEAAGRPLADVFRLVNEATLRPIDTPVARVLRDGAIVGLANHTVLLARDGRRWPIEDSAAPIRDPEGRIVGVVLVFRDATEGRRAALAGERLGLALKAGRMGVWEWNLRDDSVWWSDNLAAIHGLPDGGFGGTFEAFLALIHPDDRPRVSAAIARAVEQRASYEIEFRNVWPDGSVHWMATSGRVLCDGDGQVARMVGVAMDVTERRRTAEALRESEARFAGIFEHAPAVIFMKDRQGRYLMANRLFEQVTDKPAEQIVGRTDAELFPPELARRFHEQDEGVYASRAAHSFEEPFDYGGRHYMFLTTKFALPDGDGGPAGLCGIATDITGLKLAEQTVRAQWRIGARLNSTLDVDELLDLLVQEAIALIGAESGLSGLYTPEGMLCRRYVHRGAVVPLERRFPPMHGLPGWLIVHKRPYVTNDAAHDPQIVSELRDRFGVRAAVSTPILDAQGELVGFLELHDKRDGAPFTDADVEQLVGLSQSAAIALRNALAYHEVRRAEAALKEADRRKDEFLATLAHELRNPLAPIRTGLEIMRRARDAATVERARDIMERQVGQMVRLVDDLLDVGRITRGKLELLRERVELARVIHSAIETTRPLLDAKGHALQVSLPSDPIVVDADLTRLSQVFANLLNNAAKFTPANGRISLTAERVGGEAVVTIRDTGVGIAPEQQGRLFAMFAQVGPPIDRAQGGLGIGLALARALVEMHGGRIEAHSDGAGKGSTFVVRLPVLSEQRAAAEPSAPAYDEVGAPRMRILVVDDSRDAADSLADMLRHCGHDTSTAYGGVEALASAAALRPDVVLLDIGMPDLNGYEVARRIRAAPDGGRPVLIALTGWGQLEDKRLAAEAGFDQHLTKPVDPKRLVGLLRSLAPRR